MDNNQTNDFSVMIQECIIEISRANKEINNPELTHGYALYESATPMVLYAAAIIIIGIGVAISLFANDPYYVNRSATVVIAVGIVSAFFKFRNLKLFKRVHETLPKVLRNPKYRDYRARKVRVENPTLTQDMLDSKLEENVAETERSSRVALYHMERELLKGEIVILLAGTLLNGFGDLLIGWLVRNVHNVV